MQADHAEYDISKIINFPDIPLWKRTILRLMLPISLIKVALIFAALKPVNNVMRNTSTEVFTGKKHCVNSEKISFDDVKNSSRALNCSINDVITFSLSNALAKYFSKLGDDKTKEVSIMMPSNIRWSMYKTYDSVKLENKFAPIPIKIPLEVDPEKTMT